MPSILIDLVRTSAALAAGGVLGLGFGTLQQAARRRHETRQNDGQLKSGWSLMPGAGARVGYFVIALVLVQVICPLLFADGTQWVVSGGVAVGYGWTLYTQLRLRLKAR